MKTGAVVFAIFLIVAAFGEFVPAPHGLLFGIFMEGPMHNVIHLISGAIALFCAFAGVEAARRYFQIFGLLNALLAVMGFFYGNRALLGLVQHNKADIGLHIAIALVALILGFGIDPFVALDRESLYF